MHFMVHYSQQILNYGPLIHTCREIFSRGGKFISLCVDQLAVVANADPHNYCSCLTRFSASSRKGLREIARRQVPQMPHCSYGPA